MTRPGGPFINFPRPSSLWDATCESAVVKRERERSGEESSSRISSSGTFPRGLSARRSGSLLPLSFSLFLLLSEKVRKDGRERKTREGNRSDRFTLMTTLASRQHCRPNARFALAGKSWLPSKGRAFKKGKRNPGTTDHASSLCVRVRVLCSLTAVNCCYVSITV